ncbi:MAG: ABC transporter ATP-binding protein [Clostridiales bacterium]|nr:ABC transporter ATP-binding protein [Clostridiales bacterium]
MITVSNLSHKIDRNFILRDIDFELEKSDVLGIVGPNGAGKSTLISILAGIVVPTTGKVTYLDNNRISSKQKRNITSYVPQEIALFDELSIYDNLILFGNDKNTARLKQKVKSVLDQLCLNNEQSKKVSKLSGGMKRRVNIAVSLMKDAKYIFMDEPVVGVEYRIREDVEKMIRRMQREGKTLIISSHQFEFLENVCNKLLYLVDGNQKYFGPYNERVLNLCPY